MVQFTPTGMTLFGLTFHWYGVLMALGMASGIALCCAREKRYNVPRDTTLDLALIVIPAGIVGARLYYVLFSWREYAANPIRALFIWEGGMAVYGSIIGGLVAGFLYAKVKKLPFLRLADLFAPSVALGQAIGRWGNFVNQEAYGAVATQAWQQRFPISVFIRADGQWHFATFFYESAWCLAIVAMLLVAERKRLFRRDGGVFRTYVFLYAVERALVEGLRTDSLYLGWPAASAWPRCCWLAFPSPPSPAPSGPWACTGRRCASVLPDTIRARETAERAYRNYVDIWPDARI